MLYIFDKDDNLLEIIEDFSNDEMVRELNNFWTYKFEIDINTNKNIKRKNKVGFFNDEIFYLFSIEEIEDILFSEDIKSIYCQHDVYSLNDHVIEDKRCVNYTIEKALEKALEGTSYKVGECDVFDSNTLNFYYISSFTALKNIVDLYAAEFNPRIIYNKETNKLERYIDLNVKLGVETGLRFTYDTNINEIKRTEVLDNHYNVLYGRGSSLPTTDEEGQETGGYSRLIDFSEIVWSKANGDPIDKPSGQTYVEDLESIEKYGRLEGIYENKDIEDQSILLQSTYNMLQETKYPKISYEIDVEDLSNVEGFEHYKYTLGDRVIILDDDYNINLESRIIKEQISLKDKTKIVTLGYILPSQSSEQSKGSIINPSEDTTTDNKISDKDFPNTLPQVPVITVEREGFGSISLVWTFENKPYYTYELYASQSENFNPTENHLIFKGHGSAFLHECGFNQTWYYKARATNTHGQHTDFSQEISATTYKIDDATEIFEKAAIKEALIESLNADKISAGKVKGTFIDARNLTVTDGNEEVTFSVDSEGNVSIKASDFVLKGKTISEIVTEQTKNIIKNVDVMYYLSISTSTLSGGSWSTTAPEWVNGRYMWQKTITIYKDGTTKESEPTCIAGAIGQNGTDGVSITGVIEQYGINTSKTTVPTSWQTTFPEWSEGKYIWTRSKIIYSNGKVSYTDAYCDTSWEQVMEKTNQKVDNTQEAVFNALTNNGQTQGIYLNNGKLYINGQYINTRNLKAVDDNGNITMSINEEGFLSIIQGLINIDKEGIKINLIDSENKILGYVLYDGQGVQIFASENNAISHLTREGSFIDKLVANSIKCNELMKIANKSGCPTKWYIASQSTGDGTGRDEENKANSLADVLRRIRNYGLTFTEELNIYIESGNINEDIIVQDLNGTVINFNFSKDVVINTDKFVFEDNNARIALKGETNGISCSNNSITADEINSRPLIKTNNSDGLFKVRNSNYISIRGFKLCGNGGNCIENYNGSKILVYDCDMKNFDYGAYTSDMAQSCISSCRGSLGYLAYVGNGGIFSSTINIPKCSQSEIVDKRQSGIWIKEDSYTQLDTLQTETTTETSTNITDSFLLIDLYTLTEGEGQAVNGRKGYVGQGRLQDFKAHRGYIELPTSSILAVLNKKDSYTLKLRMTRLNEDSGYTGKVPHPVIRAVGENIQTDYWDSNVTFDRGETQDIVLAITISNAIKQGATRLELWAEANQEKQYSFYDNVNLIIEGANKETTEGGGSTGGGTTEEVINDFAYADELIEKGMTYYRVCDNEYTSSQSWSQGFTYRDSNTPLSANCVAEQDVTNSMWVKVTNSNGTSTRHYKAIDCSTFVGLCLRGYSYSESPYASETLFNSFRQDRTQKNTSVSWSIAPTNEDGSCAREASNIAKYFYNLGKGIVYLKNPDTGVVEKGSIGSSKDDYSNIKKGDLIFYAKKKDGNWKQPNRFMYISHVALCYGQSSTYNKKAVIESTNVTTKKHTFADGTEVNAGIRIKQLEAYADDIVLVVRLQESHYQDQNNSTESSTEEYTNCFNETGTINGNSYVYRLKNCKITAYGGDSSSACDISLNLAKTCGTLNLPYGSKIYIPSLDGKKITDGNGNTVVSDGIFTTNDCGVGCTDFDLYMSTKSDTDAEKVFGNTLREDVYVLSWGSGHGTAWSYTESYKWAYNNGTLSNYKAAFKDYIKFDGTLINFLKYKTNDKDIRSSSYWSILNS